MELFLTGMKTVRVVIMASVAVVAIGSAAPAQVKSVDDFQSVGVSFATTPAEFKRLHPKALSLAGGDKRYGVETYVIKPADATSVYYRFYDGRVLSIWILWEKKELDKAGGWDAIKGTLVRTYGKPAEVKSGKEVKEAIDWVYFWSSKDDRTVLMAVVSPNEAEVQVRREAVNDALKAKRKLDR